MREAWAWKIGALRTSRIEAGVIGPLCLCRNWRGLASENPVTDYSDYLLKTLVRFLFSSSVLLQVPAPIYKAYY
jgi:hypothetical protein